MPSRTRMGPRCATFPDLPPTTDTTVRPQIVAGNHPTPPVLDSLIKGTLPVRGLYVFRFGANTRRLKHLIGIADSTEVNALIIDVKDEFGLNYDSSDPMVKKNAGTQVKDGGAAHRTGNIGQREGADRNGIQAENRRAGGLRDMGLLDGLGHDLRRLPSGIEHDGVFVAFHDENRASRRIEAGQVMVQGAAVQHRIVQDRDLDGEVRDGVRGRPLRRQRLSGVLTQFEERGLQRNTAAKRELKEVRGRPISLQRENHAGDVAIGDRRIVGRRRTGQHGDNIALAQLDVRGQIVDPANVKSPRRCRCAIRKSAVQHLPFERQERRGVVAPGAGVQPRLEAGLIQKLQAVPAVIRRHAGEEQSLLLSAHHLDAVLAESNRADAIFALGGCWL